MKMRKKAMIGFLVAAAMTAQCTTAFAAQSSQSSDNEPSYSSSTTQSSTSVVVNSSGVKTTGVVTSTNAGGSTIAVAVDVKTDSGITIKVNSKGEAVVGDKVVTFAKAEAATAGLSENVVNVIKDINSGKKLSDLKISGYNLSTRKKEDGKLNLDVKGASSLNLTGYNALTGTHALVTKNVTDGKVKDTATETVIYVPNLIEGIENVAVLYYDNATGQWLLLPVTKIDTKSKLVYFTVTGSGTLSVVYKK